MLKYNFVFGILKEHLKRLADNTPPKIITYSSTLANRDFFFINIEFYSFLNNQNKKSNFIFCLKDLRKNIILLFKKHLHFHSLIPNTNENSLTSDKIWKISIEKIYNFCFINDLKHVWAYL